MEIQTKYNIGDKVWIMRNDKPEQILIIARQVADFLSRPSFYRPSNGL